MSDLVVLSHLRWTFVWQRPQHLVSRLARERKTWFVEEPLVADVDVPVVRTEEHGPVTRVWLEVPGPDRHIGFGDPEAELYEKELLGILRQGDARAVWLYTPMAYNLAQSIPHDILVYDVMDDLASFKDAPPGLRFAQQQVLHAADVVFTGGRSLYGSVAPYRLDAHMLVSGVEPEHYAVERPERRPGARPVAGYVGVIDERIDLELVGGLAADLPEWEIQMVGPVAKIDQGSLPKSANLTYPGSQPYERLPHVMAGFDVALMPFALNEATRSISPTKTLEYLAAGLPVVSTRVPDVVADYSSVVTLADDAASFAAACSEALAADQAALWSRVEPLLRLHQWDTIAARIASLIRAAEEKKRGAVAVQDIQLERI